MSIEERLPPNYQKLDCGLAFDRLQLRSGCSGRDRQLGRCSGQATCSSGSSSTRDGHLDLAIWDDGTGMDERPSRKRCALAPTFPRKSSALGKFGLGLKLASLSQAKEVRVISI